MEIPQLLRGAIDGQLVGTKKDELMIDANNISLRYRTLSGKGERLLTRDSEALAYAVARMPATFGSVYNVLNQAISSTECSPKTLIDAGAGTGAATWAAEEILDLDKVTCLERESAMISVGKTMMKKGSELLANAKWISHDLIKDKISERADLVVSSYVLNEMKQKDRIETAKKLWDATDMMLVIIEPGTPVGFSHILEVRDLLLKCGANVVAPCPHEDRCPKDESDWCHFACRISRTRLHKQLKGGEAPFEDEKYTFIAVTRDKYANIPGGRVLRHPQVRSGYVIHELCTADGIKEVTFSKKDKEKFKMAKKAKTGDLIGY